MGPIQQIAGRLSIRIQQLDVICETKTKDNVFVQVQVAVQFRVVTDRAYDAFYRLTDPRGQIQSYVYDVIRSQVPKMELDQAFAAKRDIAAATLTQLENVMRDYGYEIVNALVTDAEARYLSGLGVARQRKAMMNGLQTSVSAFSKDVKDASTKDIMDVLLLTQYMDTLSVVGCNNLILEHDPATVANLQAQVGKTFMKKRTTGSKYNSGKLGFSG